MTTPSQTNLPEPPAQLKTIQSYMRVAQDIDRVDPVVGYWLRLYSTESALKIDKDSPECKKFLVALLSWLENFKQSNKNNESVTNQIVGQAHYENFVMALFNKADTLDRAGTANKNTIRMFFMATVLFEAMAVFGPLTDEVNQRAKYAKIKAAYIQKCLKAGQTPKPGPFEGAEFEEGRGVDGRPQQEDGADQQPSEPSSSKMPQMPKPGNPSDPTTNSDCGGLYIPEVPKDPSDTSGPAAAIIPPKPTDPFIMTPSIPPELSKPTPIPMSQNNQSKSSIAEARFLAANGAPLNPEDILKGQKYCKFAVSALQYDDIPTAVDQLQKALKLLTTGQNPD